MYKTLDTILLLLSSTIAVQLNSYLINQKQNEFMSLTIAALVATLVHELAKNIILELPLRFSTLRPLLKPESRLEGSWICKLPDYEEGPYSFATIEYNIYSKKYIYSGSNYNPSGIIRDSWKSTQIEIDISNERMWYLYEAKVHDKAAETPQGYGVIDFEKDNYGKYTRARGVFIDSGTRFIKSNFFMNRLSSSDFQRLIGKMSIQTNEDLSKLIVAYSNEMQKSTSQKPQRKK